MMGGDNIQIFYEVEHFKVQSKRKIYKWLTRSAKLENKRISELNIIFCDDSYLLNINIEYLNHDYFTDIITFDNSDKVDEISGDIYISVHRAKENSIVYKEGLDREIQRLMIHGLLHLIGYSDKSDSDKNVMTSKENHYLEILVA